MGLLAGDRKKQRWSADPRGRKWAEDQNKISNKLMEKMGWKQGEGLGAKGDGMLTPIGVKYKMDNLGFGCTQKYDKQWVAHQDSFNDLLAGLSSETTGKTESKPTMADKAEVSNLGTTGKKSKHRYHKFTKAKDLSKASAKDMEGIFGRSSVSEAKAATEATKKEDEAKVDETQKFKQSEQHVTQKENVHDYFKRKMAERMARLSAPVKSEPPAEEGEQLMIKNEDVKTEPIEDGEESVEPVKKKKKSKKSKKEPVEVKTEPIEEETVVEEEKVEVKKKKKKRKQVEEENTEIEEETPKPKKKKKKQKKEIEEQLIEVEESTPPVTEKKSKKKKKKQNDSDE